MTMTTIPSISQKRWRAFQRKAACDHDHHPFTCQKRRTGQELIGGLFVKKKSLSIYCQSCKAWVGLAKVSKMAWPNFEEMDNDGQCSHYSLDHHPFPSPEQEESFSGEGCV